MKHLLIAFMLFSFNAKAQSDTTLFSVIDTSIYMVSINYYAQYKITYRHGNIKHYYKALRFKSGNKNWDADKTNSIGDTLFIYDNDKYTRQCLEDSINKCWDKMSKLPDYSGYGWPGTFKRLQELDEIKFMIRYYQGEIDMYDKLKNNAQ